MTEAQSEDAPLLFAPSSPPLNESPNIITWSREDSQPSCSTDPPNEWTETQTWSRHDEVPRTIPSQNSMDSGCECDPEGSNKDSGLGQMDTCDTKLPMPSTSQPLITQTNCDKLPNGLTRVTFRIEGYEEEEPDTREADDIPVHNGDFKELVKAATRSFPSIPSFSKSVGMLSSSSSTASMPMCRICHLPQGDGQDVLISPCRCSGTMQFIHEHCLMKWLEICSKRNKKSPTCELCNYQFNRHKKFELRHWKLPTCSLVDKLLHSLFLVCIILMLVSAGITIHCFKQDRFQKRRDNTDLTRSEIITLTCGVLFFVAFFVAMYVEVKAKDTLYRLFSRFLHLNQTWHIDEYDKRKDAEIYQSPV